MKLDKYHRESVNNNRAIEALYRNKSLVDYNFDCSADVQKYNDFCKDFDLDKLRLSNEEDFDRVNTFLIPAHYKELDIDDYIVSLIPRKNGHFEDGTLKRVEEELAIYRSRNLYPVLQTLIYIIDTMRKNNLVWGVGRGSSVASYVLYLIGVHKINSLQYNLDIREFLKEE